MYGTVIIMAVTEALKIVLEYCTDDLSEVGEIDRTDPFCVLKFLQKVNHNYLNWVKKNSAKLTKTICNATRLITR